ncbi:hypothetical protein EV175_007376 [Coemansia sp. RSA 1933]|nr:hypothetical protein EV175_007376 [Coemansia sp. RSA 1933]
MSPTEYPVSCSYGSIYTFFLYSPIVAFSVISQIAKIAAQRWTKLESLFTDLEDLCFELINAQLVGQNTRRFLTDAFLRQIMCRHVLCCAVLKLHLDFERPEHQPQSAPESFGDVISAPALLRKVRDVVEFCSVEELYKMDDSLQSSSSPHPEQQESAVVGTASHDAVVPDEPSDPVPEDPAPNPANYQEQQEQSADATLISD